MFNRSNTLRYLTLVGAAVVSVLFSSLFMDLAKGNLTYRTWVPFDYTSPAAFMLVYTNQMIAMTTSGLVNVACESLLCGLLLHICCQFDILEYRLTKITQHRNVLRDCIRHHDRILVSVASSLLCDRELSIVDPSRFPRERFFLSPSPPGRRNRFESSD